MHCTLKNSCYNLFKLVYVAQLAPSEYWHSTTVHKLLIEIYVDHLVMFVISLAIL